MTTNVFDDNLALWAASLNALANADAGEAIESGCSVSKGTGDWDSDVTAGTVRLGGVSVSVSADTVTHSDASGLSAGESRVDLITADSAGTLSITEGTGAANPASPDIPADEVVVGFWIIAEGDTTLANSDLFDVPGLYLDQTAPIFGDGSDGSITRSSNGNENGLIYATDYTVESGTTMTVSNGVLVVHATESITIDGEIDATTATSGGAGGNAVADDTNGENGTAGTAADVFSRTGTGGTGGADNSTDSGDPGGAGAGGGGGATTTGTGFSGGDGGDAGGFTGNQLNSNQIRQLRQLLTASWDTIYDLSMIAGGSGGGGGSGGRGAAVGSGGGGGDGGDGGGVVILLSPSITITGTVNAGGEDGADGADGGGGTGGGGGGGGGSGGVLALLGSNVTVSGTTDVSGGSGGAAGTGGTDAGDGGAGGDGQDGLEVSP